MVRVLTISEGSRLHLYMYIQSSMVLEGLVWRKLKRRRNGEMEGFGGFGIWFLMKGEKEGRVAMDCERALGMRTACGIEKTICTVGIVRHQMDGFKIHQ